jgi:hypothetical protein
MPTPQQLPPDMAPAWTYVSDLSNPTAEEVAQLEALAAALIYADQRRDYTAMADLINATLRPTQLIAILAAAARRLGEVAVGPARLHDRLESWKPGDDTFGHVQDW